MSFHPPYFYPNWERVELLRSLRGAQLIEPVSSTPTEWTGVQVWPRWARIGFFKAIALYDVAHTAQEIGYNTDRLGLALRTGDSYDPLEQIFGRRS